MLPYRDLGLHTTITHGTLAHSHNTARPQAGEEILINIPNFGFQLKMLALVLCRYTLVDATAVNLGCAMLSPECWSLPKPSLHSSTCEEVVVVEVVAGLHALMAARARSTCSSTSVL